MRDFRVRAYQYIVSESTALSHYNHVMGLYDSAVDINPDKPNAEPRLVEIGDSWIVEYDLTFPFDKEGMARGLFNHTKNIPAVKLPDGKTGFVSLERCGHRIKQRCDILERYDVE